MVYKKEEVLDKAKEMGLEEKPIQNDVAYTYIVCPLSSFIPRTFKTQRLNGISFILGELKK